MNFDKRILYFIIPGFILVIILVLLDTRRVTDAYALLGTFIQLLFFFIYGYIFTLIKPKGWRTLYVAVISILVLITVVTAFLPVSSSTLMRCDCGMQLIGAEELPDENQVVEVPCNQLGTSNIHVTTLLFNVVSSCEDRELLMCRGLNQVGKGVDKGPCSLQVYLLWFKL